MQDGNNVRREGIYASHYIEVYDPSPKASWLEINGQCKAGNLG